MRELIGRIVHSPWFVLFVLAVPIALVIATVDSLAPKLRVTGVTVDVTEKQPNGDNWDKKGNPPDPKITLEQGKDKLATCDTSSDTFHAICAPDAIAHTGKPLVVHVEDVDTLTPDRIGTVTLDLPAAGGTLAAEHVDGIAKLTVVTVAVPGFLTTHRDQLIGIAIGVGVGLLAWLLFLRTTTNEHVLTAIALCIALPALVLGGLIAADRGPPTPPALPAAMGALAATLGAFDAAKFKPLRIGAALGIFLGAAAIFAPVVMKAALIVVGVGVVWLVLLAILDEL